jgi:acetyltransferase (GNAT) family protein
MLDGAAGRRAKQSVVVTSMVADDGEQLTSGWEPEVDAGDSAVRGCVLVHASWAVAQARAAGRAWHDGPSWAGGYAGDRGAMVNQVVVKQPLVDLERVVTEAEQLIPPSVAFLLVSPWPTTDLRPLGLGLVGHPPLMYRPWSEADDAAGSDLELRWVTGVEELAAAERVLVDGYPMPELQPFTAGCLYPPALLDGSTRVVVAYDAGTPIATASAHSAHGITLVEGVAVPPAARGKRAGAAVAEAASTAFPGQPAALLASDDGQPVYARLGYLRLERWTVWLRPPAGEP